MTSDLPSAATLAQSNVEHSISPDDCFTDHLQPLLTRQSRPVQAMHLLCVPVLFLESPCYQGLFGCCTSLPLEEVDVRKMTLKQADEDIDVDRHRDASSVSLQQYPLLLLEVIIHTVEVLEPQLIKFHLEPDECPYPFWLEMIVECLPKLP